MSRLAAQQKLLFYPTPANVVNLIASNVKPSEVGGAILDPCCGDGEPVLALAVKLNLIAHGNELHPGRFREASGKLRSCTNGAREFLRTDGQFDVVFDNPPYDQSVDGRRMEAVHIRADLELLAPGGLGVWVLPETIMDWSMFYELCSKLDGVAVRRFPDPEYAAFRQVVVFGNKVSDKGHYGSHEQANHLAEQKKEGFPVIMAREFGYAVPAGNRREVPLRVEHPDLAETVALAGDEGVHGSPQWEAMFGGSQPSQGFRPLLPLGSGHMALAIAAGVVDSMETVIDGSPCLIKGSTSKHVAVTREEDGDDVKIVKRETFTQVISSLNLETGRLTRLDSKKDSAAFAEFLTAHQDELVRSIRETFPPLFDPERDMDSWMDALLMVHAPGKLPGQDRENGLLPAQQVRAAALAEKLRTAKGVVLVGEMGSGKTCCSQAVVALTGRGNWKLVVLTPANVCQKWKREAARVLREFGVKAHVIGEQRRQPDGTGKVRKVARPVQDVVKAMEEPNPSVLVVSYETAKNASRWEHQVAWRAVSETWTETERVETPYYPYTKFEQVEKQFTGKVACCPDCGEKVGDGHVTTVRQLGKKQRKCAGCGAQLWQRIPFKYGGRVAVADFLNRKYPGRFSLIIDELHNTKGADTDISYACNDLVSAARKVVAMTGTIYSGKASSIFYLMHRLFPWFREQYGYDEVKRFVEHHGLLQETVKVKKSDRWNSSYGYGRENVRVKEIPGVSPVIVMSLLNNTAFLKLKDMGLEMPPYSEERVPVQPGPELRNGLDALDEVREKAVQLARKGNPALFSAWLYAALGWPDHPIDETLEVRDRDTGETVNTFRVPGAIVDGGGESTAKDEALLEIIESELAQGRGVGVYFSQVIRRDWMTRIKKLLDDRGIYGEVFRSNTVKPNEREAWYGAFVRRCRARGQEPVLLANGNLVKEGLDLVELPTLIEAGIEYRLNDLRQRDRRSWRLTQDKPVRVIFLYYEDSWQETALQLVAEKLKAALIVDGTLAEGLAAMKTDDSDLLDTLMKMVRQDHAPGRWNGQMKVAEITKPSKVKNAMPIVVSRSEKKRTSNQDQLVQASLF